MKEVLLGKQAKKFLKILENNNYINKEKYIIGGVFLEKIRKGKCIYVGFDCSGNETFVEEFDDVVEATKYTSGIMAKTINNNLI